MCSAASSAARTDEEIDALVARYAEGHKLLFTVNTLEYLAKGGRIGRAAALAGSILNVKPILTIRDGEVVPLKKVRGNHKAFAAFQELFEETTTDSETLRVGIAHAVAPERMEALRKMVAHVRPQRAARDRNDARRGRRHARRPRHGRFLLVRRQRRLRSSVRTGSSIRSRWQR